MRLISTVLTDGRYYQTPSITNPNSEHNKTLSLLEIAATVKDKKRVSPELMQATILKLCVKEYLLLKTLAELVERSPDTIRTHYVTPMLKKSN